MSSKTISLIASLGGIFTVIITIVLFFYSQHATLNRIEERQAEIQASLLEKRDASEKVISQNTQAIKNLERAVMVWKDSQTELLRAIIQLKTGVSQ